MPKRFIENLRRYGDLSGEEQEGLAATFAAVRNVESGGDVAVEGDRPTHCHVLLEGQTFRHRTLEDGRRQIMSFQVRGDLCDLQGAFLPMDNSVTALTRCQVAVIPHARLAEVMQSRPGVAQALWRASLAEAAVFREWMVGMGRRTAYARIAHFFCEIFMRQSAAGLVQQDRCRFPITQQHLSDSLGLSMVHTNRTLQALRADGLLSFQGGMLTIRDWNGLKAAGEFDPRYLHLDLAA
ncbi:MAG: Crp/Fnr family transcriptional regulator [Phenylobacterium sp.]